MNWFDQLVGEAPNKEVAQKVAEAVKVLFAKDGYLLIEDVNERSISHHLAVHLEKQFQSWHVDCEYNRDGHNPKRLHLTSDCTNNSELENGSRVFPDIIIHKRGTRENHLVIEIKKSTSHLSSECDLEKLTQYRNELGYDYGLFLELVTKQDNPGTGLIQWST